MALDLLDLPLEIVEMIIDRIPRKYFAEARLTCRLFHQAMSKNLYGQLVLEGSRSELRSKDLRTVYCDRPVPVLDFIRVIDFRWMEDKGWTLAKWNSRGKQLTADSKAFEKLFRRLERCPPETLRELKIRLQHPKTPELENHLSRLIARYKDIVDLEIPCYQLRTAGWDIKKGIPLHSKLQSLSVTIQWDEQDKTDWFRRPNSKELPRPDDTSLELLWGTVNANASTIERLELDFRPGPYSSWQPFSIALGNMRTICGITQNLVKYPEEFRMFPFLEAQLSPQLALREIVISNFRFFDIEAEYLSRNNRFLNPSSLEVLELHSCGGLNCMVSNLDGKFPSLRSLHITGGVSVQVLANVLPKLQPLETLRLCIRFDELLDFSHLARHKSSLRRLWIQREPEEEAPHSREEVADMNNFEGWARLEELCISRDRKQLADFRLPSSLRILRILDALNDIAGGRDHLELVSTHILQPLAENCYKNQPKIQGRRWPEFCALSIGEEIAGDWDENSENDPGDCCVGIFLLQSDEDTDGERGKIRMITEAGFGKMFPDVQFLGDHSRPWSKYRWDGRERTRE
ncbi:hypothetical protein TWF281_006074 [Arthrobotrys megalospora]